MATYSTNKERTNYSRLCRAIIDLCTDVLRNILTLTGNPRHIKFKLSMCSMQDRKSLRPNQWDCINKSCTSGSYKEFDITLLCQVLRLISVQDLRVALKTHIDPKNVYTEVQNCPALTTYPGTKLNTDELLDVRQAVASGTYENCKNGLLWKLYQFLCPSPYPNIHPTSTWGYTKLPDPCDITLGDDIERIRLIRNTVYGHIPTTAISGHDFNAYWVCLENIMTRMDQQLTNVKYRQELDYIKTTCMDESSEKRYCEELKRLYDEEREVKLEVQQLEQKVESAVKQSETRFAAIEAKTSLMSDSVDKLHSENETKHQESKIVAQRLNSKIEEAQESIDQMKVNINEFKASTSLYPGVAAIKEQTLKRMEEHRCDKTFITTQPIKKGEDILEEYGILIYSGLPGSGKTKNAVEVMKRYQDAHPDCLFLDLHDVRDWRYYVNPNIHSIILLDDCIGKTNTDTSILNTCENLWPTIHACITKGNVKVIMTIRKNIFAKNISRLEKFQLFKIDQTIDLHSADNNLTDENKIDILRHHCENNNIEICPDSALENYYCTYKENNDPLRLSKYTLTNIIRNDPFMGFPFACFLFACNRKYTTLGVDFFTKPTQSLIDDINNLMDSTANDVDKLQYCIMSYMLFQGGAIKLENLHENLFNTVLKSLKLQAPSQRERNEALSKLNYMYIEQVNPSEFKFTHQTILESVAICFYQDNPSLLLELCDVSFIEEFIRPSSYEKSEGEIVLTIKQTEYGKLVERFLHYLEDVEVGDDDFELYDWWVKHPLMDDECFVNTFRDTVNSADEYKCRLRDHLCGYNGIFCIGCNWGKVYFVDMLFNMFKRKVDIRWYFDISSIIWSGYSNIYTWLLDHNMLAIGLFDVDELKNSPAEKLNCIMQLPAITLDHVVGAINGICRNCDRKTIKVLFAKWPDLHESVVLRLLHGLSLHGDYKVIDTLLDQWPNVITQENMTKAFTWACIGDRVDAIEYFLNLQLSQVDAQTIYKIRNKEKLTLLHFVAFFGKYDSFRKLLNLGLCPDAKTISEISVFQMVILGYLNTLFCFENINIFMQKGSSEIIPLYCKELKQMLLDNSERYNYEIRHHITLMKYFRDNIGIDITDFGITVDKVGSNFVHWCALANKLPISLFFKTNANPLHLQSKNNENVTGIHIAALLGNWNLFNKFIEFGVDVTEKTTSGFTVFQMAILGYINKIAAFSFSGFYKKVIIFFDDKSPTLSYYFRFNAKRVSPAALVYYEKIIDHLIYNTIFSRKMLHNQDYVPMFFQYCVLYNDISIVELLFSFNSNTSNLCFEKEENLTVIHIAAFFGRWMMICKLVSLGFSVTERTRLGVSALQLASFGYAWRGDKYKRISKSLQCKSPLISEYCETLDDNFKFGSLSDYENIIKYLIIHKDFTDEDLDMSVDDFGHSLAHFCVVYNSPSVIDLLSRMCPYMFSGTYIYTLPILYNANPVHTPLQLAVLLGRSDIFQLIYLLYKDNLYNLYSLWDEGFKFADQALSNSFFSPLDCLWLFPTFFDQAISIGSIEDYEAISESLRYHCEDSESQENIANYDDYTSIVPRMDNKSGECLVSEHVYENLIDLDIQHFTY